MTQSNISHDPVQDTATPVPVPKPPYLSVIIVSWNVRTHLVRCLQALFSAPVCGDLDIEVIVVDNASTDGSADAIRDFPVTLIRNPTNLGYGRANNIGLQAAQGRYLLILNPDTIPQPDSLRHLSDFAASHPNAGIVAPRLLNPDCSLQNAAFHFPTLPMVILDLFPPPRWLPGRLRLKLLRSQLNGRYPEQSQSAPFPIDHPLGACFLINRQAYAQRGGFNENIFMYSEEIDLALRYAAAGWECWQEPASQVIHLGGQSTRQLPDRMFVELWRSRIYLYDTYYTPLAAFSLRAILAIAMLKKIALSAPSRLLHGDRDQASRQQFRKWAATLRLALAR